MAKSAHREAEPGDDRNIRGDDHAEHLHGDDRGDTIHGRGGDDAITGGKGLDDLFGDLGDDRLNGGAGDDHLTGGLGHDILTGGLGADTFAFKSIGESTMASSGRDLIEDFHRAQHDHIDLRGIDANTHASGNQGFHFIGDDGFGHHAGELRAVYAGANTLVSGDVNGDGKADFAVTLKGHVALHADDFYL